MIRAAKRIPQQTISFFSPQRMETGFAAINNATDSSISAIPTGLTRSSETPPEKASFSHSDTRSAPFHKETRSNATKGGLLRGTTLFTQSFHFRPLHALRGAPRPATPFTRPSPKRPSPLCIPGSLSAGEPPSLGDRLQLLLFVIDTRIITHFPLSVNEISVISMALCPRIVFPVT